MLEKSEILVVIFAILFLFYLVISWGAGKKTSQSPEIKRYLFGVRILIIIIAIVALILWFFL